ncbi:MAG: hypothetical protein ACOC4M_07365 [Promethearchaeia archaeon]
MLQDYKNRIEKLEDNAKYCLIFDFDGTLYYNPDHDYTDCLIKAHIFSAPYFFKRFDLRHGIDINGLISGDYNTPPRFYYLEGGKHFLSKDALHILITGRHRSQKEKILDVLRKKQYKFDEAFFLDIPLESYPDGASQAELNTFNLHYWNYKMQIINSLNNLETVEKTILIDDDPIICELGKALKINTYTLLIYESRYGKNLKKDVYGRFLCPAYQTPHGLYIEFEQCYPKDHKNTALEVR